MNYSYKDNYILFDKIYPIKKITFKNNLKTVKWAINKEIYNTDKMNIEKNTVYFDRVHLRFLELDKPNQIENIELFDGYVITEDLDINNVFRRNDGWAGADGVYSHLVKDKLHWYFSDTLVGPVDPKTRTRESLEMVNNTIGVSPSNEPFNIEFKVKKDEQGKYTSFYAPTQKGEYYWLQDGCVVGDYLYISVIRVRNDKEKWFVVLGSEMLRVPIIGDQLDYDNYERYQNHSYFNDKGLTYTFGAAVLDDTSRTGYYYMFGYDNNEKRNLVMLRLKDFFNNETYEFYTEDGWSKTPKNFKTIGLDTSHEMRMIYDDGKYIITYTRGCATHDVMFAYTSNLEDGFTDYTEIYQTVEQVLSDVVITYNAKVHVFPVIDVPLKDHVLNVNSTKIEALYDADIYYPRWIKLTKVSDSK